MRTSSSRKLRPGHGLRTRQQEATSAVKAPEVEEVSLRPDNQMWALGTSEGLV